MPPFLRLVLVGSAVPVAAAAQTVHFTFDGDSSGDALGASVRAAGDVDQDGTPDLIVGAPGDGGHGSAWVLSGSDAAVLHVFHGENQGDKFGVVVASAGDVDRDGHPDLIVGAPSFDGAGAGSGRAYVYSGVGGALLFTFEGQDEGDLFGNAVAGIGDADGDGFDDLAVGAPFDDDAGTDAGRVWVFSGADGSVLHVLDGDAPGAAFGAVLDGVGDVDQDGSSDLVVGAPFDDDQGTKSGSVRVHSGGDGSVLYTFSGDQAGDQFGSAVAGAGDVDGDGRGDWIVGARGADAGGSNSGMARVFSGANGALLWQFVGAGPDLSLGRAVGGAGDVDGDGLDDLIVGETRDDGNGGTTGSARVFSGADGSTLHELDWHTTGDSFGRAVDGVGDVDGDGFDDLVVGDSHDFANGSDSGSATVFSGRALVGTTYCSPAVANSTGKPGVLQAFGSVEVADNLLFLAALDLPQKKFGYFITSEIQGFSQPPIAQGNLCLGGKIGRFVDQILNSGSAGTYQRQVDLTDWPPTLPPAVLPGETWHFQSWYRDNNPGPTSNFTDAVSVTFR